VLLGLGVKVEAENVSTIRITLAQWVYQNIHHSNTSAPFCATGNSAGSAAITHSVAHYGLDSIFAFIEPTSGPPLARLDYGCVGNQSQKEKANLISQTGLYLCRQRPQFILSLPKSLP